MMIKCEICNKQFSGLVRHLTVVEKISKEEYFLKYPSSYNSYQELLKINIMKYIVINKINGCWEWKKRRKNHINDYGYGIFKGEQAYRISYKLFKGEIHEGMLVCHTCDNPSCINPDHLYCGSHQTNSEDMKNRGRSLTGDKNPAKKTESRDKIKNNNSMKKLENRIKVSQSQKGVAKVKYIYTITSPNGQIFSCNILSKFCKENNLDYRQLLELSNGKRRYISGWNCVRLAI